jgi:hypothetical protein
MSLAEIKAEISKLTPEERAELRRELMRNPLDDSEYMAEIERRHAEMLRGVNKLTKEEVYARLRAAGRQV